MMKRTNHRLLKGIFMLIMLCTATQQLMAQDSSNKMKVMVPPFEIYKVEVICGGKGLQAGWKKIHVQSDAQTASYWNNIILEVRDVATTTIIGTWYSISTDFYTQPLNISDGRQLSIALRDGLLTGHAGYGNPFLRTAPNCTRRYSEWPGYGIISKNLLLFAGGGITVPGGGVKAQTLSGNGLALQLALQYNFIQKRHFSFGINTGAGYEWSSNTDITTVSPYQVTRQSMPPVLSAKGSGGPNNAGFRFEAGPSAIFFIKDRIGINPGLNAAYCSFTNKSLTVTQTSSANGTTRSWDLLKMQEATVSGPGMVPRLRLMYRIGHVGIWGEGYMLFGPNIKTVATVFHPEGLPHPDGTYDLGQMNTPTYTQWEKSTSYRAAGLSGGITIALGKPTKTGRSPAPTTGFFKDSPLKADTLAPEGSMFPKNIQKLMDEQDRDARKTFEYKDKASESVQSKCNFEVKDVAIECNGKDSNGRKKYAVTVQYQNLSTAGISHLGHYITACTPNATNGSYLETVPSGSAIISGLSPASSASTVLAPVATQAITFNIVPQSGFISLRIKGNTVSGADCGNCNDNIGLNLPDCCDGCDLNPVVANPVSVASTNPNQGTIQVVNAISSTSNIVRIDADLVCVKYLPTNPDCIKCNNRAQNQDNFIGTNHIQGIGWANSGNPVAYYGENTANAQRSLGFATTSTTGINLSTPANITHTIGVPPVSCCNDRLEIWIRYRVWDRDCRVCEKLVRSTISRQGSCAGSDTGTSTPATGTRNINLQN